MSGHHKVKTQHCDGPLDGCHRALVLNPFNGKNNCIAGGGNYQCCKIPSDMQGTELIELTTQFTVDISDTSGNILFEVVPNIIQPVRILNTYTQAGIAAWIPPFGTGTQFNGLAVTNTASSCVTCGSATAVLSSTSATRVVAMGIVIEPNQQLMNQAGTICIANFPPDPYHRLVSNLGPTSINDLKQQPGALSTRNVKGMHAAWVPHDNCQMIAQPAVGINVPTEYRYESWLYQDGSYTYNGYDANRTIGHSSSTNYTMAEKLMSRMFVGCSGFTAGGDTPAAVTGALTCYLTMHVEVIPLNVNRPISSGLLGFIPTTSAGAPGDAATNNSVESIIALGSSLPAVDSAIGGKAKKVAARGRLMH